MVCSPLFVARRETPPLLEPVDQPLHPVAFTGDCPVEGSCAPLVALPRDGDADAAPSQIGPDLPTAVALVTDNPVGSQSWTPTASSCNCPLLHQPFKRRRLVTLARRQHKGDRLSVSLAAEVDIALVDARQPPTVGLPLSHWSPKVSLPIQSQRYHVHQRRRANYLVARRRDSLGPKR